MDGVEAESVIKVLQTGGFSSIGDFLNDQNTDISQTAADALKEFEKSGEGAALTVENLTAASKKLHDQQEETNKSFSANGLLGKGVNLLKTLGSAVANVGVSMLATWAIESVANRIYETIHVTEIAIEKGKEAQQTIKDINDEFDSKKDFVDDSGARFGELREGVDGNTNKNISLTNEEYSEYLSLCNEIADIYPELVTSYDAQGNAILNLGSNADTVTSQLQGLLDTEQAIANIEIGNNLQAVYKGIKAEYEELQKNIERYEADAVKNDEIIKALDSASENSIYSQLDKVAEGKGTSLNFEYDEELNSIIRDAFKDSGVYIGSDIPYDTNGDGTFDTQFFDLFWNVAEEQLPNVIQDIKENISAAAYRKSGSESGTKAENLFKASSYKKEQQALWGKLLPSVQASFKTNPNYNDLSDEIQTGIMSLIGDIDISTLEIPNDKDIETYLKEKYLHTISNVMNDTSNEQYVKDAQSAIQEIFSLPTNELNAEEYVTALDEQLTFLKEYFVKIGEEQGFDGEQYYQDFVVNLGFKVLDEDGKVVDSKTALLDKLEDIATEEGSNIDELNLNELTVDQLVTVETRVEDNNESVEKAVEEVRSNTEDIVNSSEPIKFSSLLEDEEGTLSSGADEFQSAISSIQSALSSLSKDESIDLTDLVQEFPELVGQTENLEEALLKLKSEKLGNVISDIFKSAKEAGVTGDEWTNVGDFVKNLIRSTDISDVDFSVIRKAIEEGLDLSIAEVGKVEHQEAINSWMEELLVPQSLPELVKTEWFSSAVSQYQDVYTQLREAQDKIASGTFTNSDFIDLTNVFPELANETGDLSHAIDGLLDAADGDILAYFTQKVNALRDAGMDEEANALQRYADSLMESVQEIEEAATRIGGMTIKTPGLDAYNKAKESADEGATYESLKTALEETKELYDKGLWGTDDFKAGVALFSPTGATDAENFMENYGKAQRYLTDDSSGVINFLNDLESKGYASFETMSDGTKQWTYDIENLEETADDMGMSFEWLMGMFGRLSDYGFANDFVSSTEEGVSHLADLYKDLSDAEAELVQLYNEDPGNTTAIQAKIDEIETLHGRIDTTKEALQQLLTVGSEDAATQVKAGKAAIRSMQEELTKLDKNDVNYESIKAIIEDQIQAIAEEYHIDLSADLSVEDSPSEEVNRIIEEYGDEGKIIKEKITSGMKDAESEIKPLIDSLSQYSNEQLSSITFGDGQYGEGAIGDAERTIDQLLSSLGLGQEHAQLLLAILKEIGEVDYDSSSKDLNDALNAEQQKIEEWGLTEFGSAFDQSGNSFTQTKFGNVDMDKRAIITWSDELKETYKDALSSWDYDPEIGSIDTVFGGSSRFGEGILENGVEIAFTPIMVTDGEADFLNRNTVTEYIESLVSESTVDGVFSEEKLLSLDKEGRQVGETFVQGIIAGADEGLNYENNGNWAETVGRLMHFSGEYGAIKLAYNSEDVVTETQGAVEQAQTVAEENPVIVPVETVSDGESPNIEGTGSISIQGDNTEAIQSANEAQAYANDQDSKINVGADTRPATKSVAKLTDKISSTTVNVPVGADASQLETDINTALSGEFKINVSANVSGLPEKEYYTGTMIAPAHANGTVYSMWSDYRHSTGAYANGTSQNWALKNDETALVNELGMESRVRNGRWELIPGGAHFESLKKGDIIFNHKQTAELIKYGRILSTSGRGQIAHADGTAFNMIHAYSEGGGRGSSLSLNVASSSNLQQDVSKLGSTSGSTAKKVSSLDEAIKKLERTFDWVEVRLDRIQKDIDYDTALADNAVGYKKKNEKISNAQTNTKALISANEIAASRYSDQAKKAKKKVGLSDKLYNKLLNGSLDENAIQELSEDDKKRVDAVQPWVDKMYEAQLAVEQTKTSLKELAQTKLGNITEEFDAVLSHIEHSADMINGYMEQAEVKGYADSAKYYEGLKAQSEKSISEMEKERAALVSSLQASIEEGTIDENSVEWYNMQAQINEVSKSIQDANTQVAEYNDNIRQIEWDRFDKQRESVARLTEEADFLIDLMSSDDLFDDKGNITDAGLATAGLHGQNYNVYMEQANEYAAKAAEIQKQIAKEPWNTKLIDQYEEYIDKQRESILAAEDEKQAIKDLVQEGIDKELEALDELIDKYTEALDSQKDLNDYQKTVADKSKEVAKIQKQLEAYKNDDSEEGKSKRQKLEAQLKEAQEDLQETEYDKYISDQKDLLSDLREEYEEVLNGRLDDLDELVSNVVQQVNDSASDISKTLEEQTSSVGYTMSEEMKAIWGDNGSITNVLSTYSSTFSSTMTTVQSSIDGILGKLTDIYNASDSNAQEGVKNSSGDNPNNPQTGKNTQAAAEYTKNNGKKDNGKKNDKKTDDPILKIINKGNANKTAIEKDKQKNHSKLWKYIVDKYKHIPTYAIYKELGKALGFTPKKNYKTDADTNGLLKKLKAKGYASGTPNVPKEDDYWTNEQGQEYIIRKSDGAMLQRLFPGDKVLNAQSSENIYNFAANPQKFVDALNVGNIPSSVKNSSTTVGDMTVNINLPNVTQYEEFVSQLQRDKKFEGMIQSMTIGRMNGSSKLGKYKTKF